MALEGAANAGAETALLDLRELGLPMYDPDHEEPTPAVSRLTELCDRADGMLWSSPMYQGTISGSFKNALDWLHLLEQPRAAVSARQGGRADQRGRRHPGPAGDQHDGVLDARAARLGGPVRRSGRRRRIRVFDADGTIKDETVELQLRTLGAEVVRVAERFTADPSLHHMAECDEAADRVATA